MTTDKQEVKLQFIDPNFYITTNKYANCDFYEW